MQNIMVTRSFLPPKDEYFEKIGKIWDSRWLTNNGDMHLEFEMNLRDYLSCENIELYTNGHMALDIAIKAMGITGEVITTPFTFASTTHALVMNGIKPVFCDIRLDTYCIDEEKIEALINENTTAILAVHVYGQPCSVQKLNEICKKHNLKLIYDAAHAFGVCIDGEPITNFGDLSMLSFHATKVFHSIEGGANIFRNKELGRSLRNLRNFGIEGPESVVSTGLNAKMNEFAAAMGLCNLKYIEQNIADRERVVEEYKRHLSVLDGIKMINYQKNGESKVKDNYAYFPVVIDERKTGFTRDQLFEALQQEKIFSRKYFYPLVTDFECYREHFKHIKVPVAKWVSQRVLTLPIYAELDVADVVRICKLILGMKKE